MPSFFRQLTKSKPLALLLLVVLSLSGGMPVLADTNAEAQAAFASGDYRRAREIWTELSDNGDPVAQFNLGVLYDEGLGIPADPAKARSLWQRAATAGLTRAVHNLALLEIDQASQGKGDLKAARALLEQAAEAGHSSARYSLGKMYEYGLGVDADATVAVQHISVAAEAGLPRAQYSMGKIYRDGAGIEPDEARSLAWFERAARAGHAGGQGHFARRLATQDTETARIEAFSFALLAVRAGNEAALQIADDLKDRMNVTALDRAFALAGDFRPETTTGPLAPAGD